MYDLSQNEKEIFEVIKANGTPMRMSEIKEEMKKIYHNEWKTPVYKTFLTRLVQFGLVSLNSDGTYAYCGKKEDMLK